MAGSAFGIFVPDGFYARFGAGGEAGEGEQCDDGSHGGDSWLIAFRVGGPAGNDAGYQAPGPGRERVWLNVYSPSRRSPPASPGVTRRTIIVFVGAALAKAIDSW